MLIPEFRPVEQLLPSCPSARALVEQLAPRGLKIIPVDPLRGIAGIDCSWRLELPAKLAMAGTNDAELAIYMRRMEKGLEDAKAEAFKSASRFLGRLVGAAEFIQMSDELTREDQDKARRGAVSYVGLLRHYLGLEPLVIRLFGHRAQLEAVSELDQPEAAERRRMVDSMCLTMRHDFGLDKSADFGFSSGMTDGERQQLQDQMGKLYDHHFAPALAAVTAERDQLRAALKQQSESEDAV